MVVNGRALKCLPHVFSPVTLLKGLRTHSVIRYTCHVTPRTMSAWTGITLLREHQPVGHVALPVSLQAIGNLFLNKSTFKMYFVRLIGP